MKYLRTPQEFKKMNEEFFHGDLEDLDIDMEDQEMITDDEEFVDELPSEVPVEGELPIEDAEVDEFEDGHIIDDVEEMPPVEDIDGDGVVDVIPSAEADEYTAYADWEEPDSEEIHPDDLIEDPLGDETVDVEEIPSEEDEEVDIETERNTIYDLRGMGPIV